MKVLFLAYKVENYQIWLGWRQALVIYISPPGLTSFLYYIFAPSYLPPGLTSLYFSFLFFIPSFLTSFAPSFLTSFTPYLFHQLYHWKVNTAFRISFIIFLIHVKSVITHLISCKYISIFNYTECNLSRNLSQMWY